MRLGEQLHLYSSILGNSDNAITTRFKLVRAIIRNRGVDDFYFGVRMDDTGLLNFNDISIDSESGKLNLYHIVTAKSSIFRRVSGTNYYCDVLDNWEPCTLIKDNTYSSSRGCCNLEKIDAKELVKIKIDGGN